VGQDDAVAWHEEPPLLREEVVAVVRQVRAEGLSHAPRSSRQSVLEEGNLPRFLFSADARVICAFDDVSRSNQTSVWLAQLSYDDVDRMMQTVGEIAVEVAGRTEQGLVPVGHAPIRVRSGITFACVRFHLGYPDGYRLLGSGALQDTAEQSWGDLEDITSKEITARKAQFAKVAH
jgi:hypothetical protein